MRAKEIRDLTTSEIEEQIKSLKEELSSPRFQLATDQLEETARIRTARKTVTRLKTVACEGEVEQSRANQ